MTALPSLPPHRYPGASSWEFHSPARSPFPPAVGHSLAPRRPSAGGEDGLPAGGVGAAVLGASAEEEKESWAERVGVQVPGSLLSDTPCVCVCAHVHVQTSLPHPTQIAPPARLVSMARKERRAQSRDRAGSPGDAPGGCRALRAEAGGHPAPQKLLPTRQKALLLCRDGLALRSSGAMMAANGEKGSL